MNNLKDLWDRDDVQFPRLLSEIWAVGLSSDQMIEISSSTGLNHQQIRQLFLRAEETFEAMKEHLYFVDENCVSCNRKF